MTVQDIMTKSPAVCTPQTSVADAARMMVEHDCGALPVVETQESPRPVGVITDRDIVIRLVAEGRNPLDASVADAMSAGVATVASDRSIEEAMGVMEDNQVRRVPVVDDRGMVIGMIAQADIALNAPEHESAELLRELSEEEELNERIPLGGAYSG